MFAKFCSDKINLQTVFLIIPLLVGFEFILGLFLVVNLYVPVASIFLLILTIVVILRPKLGVLWVVVLVPLVNLTFLGVGHSIYEPLFPVFGLTVVAWILTKRLTHLPRLPFVVPLIVLMCWSIVGLLWAPDFKSGLFFSMKFMFSICLVYLFLIVIDSWQYLKTILWVWWGGGVVNSLLSIILIKHSYNPEWDSYDLDRWCGVFTIIPNAYALYIITAIFFTLALISITDSRFQKRLLMLSLPLLLLMLGLTGSRGGMLAFLIGIIISTFLFMKKKSFLFLAIICFFVIFLSALILTGVEIPGVNRLKDLFSPENTTVTMRLAFWGYALNLLARTWGLGVGPYGYNYLGELEYSSAFSGAHNIFLSILADYGFIGFVLFVIFLIQMARFIFGYAQKLKNTPFWPFYVFIFSGLFSVFVMTNVEDIDITYRVIWAYIGIGFAPAFFCVYNEEKAEDNAFNTSGKGEQS